MFLTNRYYKPQKLSYFFQLDERPKRATATIVNGPQFRRCRNQPRTQGRLLASAWLLVSVVYPGTADWFKQSDRFIFNWRKVPKLLLTTLGSKSCDSKIDNELRLACWVPREPSYAAILAVLGQVENIWMLSLRTLSQFALGDQGLQLQRPQAWVDLHASCVFCSGWGIRLGLFRRQTTWQRWL